MTDKFWGQCVNMIDTTQGRNFLHLHLADAFIQSDLQCIQVIHFLFVSMCVPWELNPQPLRY